MHTAPFDRLVRALDLLAGATQASCVIQIGASDYVPVAARWFRFASADEVAALIDEAEVVVTHAADTILDAMRPGKRIVAVPRQRRFYEHIDDHQLDLARKLRETIGLPVVEDVAQLQAAIRDSHWVAPSPENESRRRLVSAVRTAIGELL